MESLGKCPYSPSLTSSTGFHKNGESWLNFSVVFCTCLLIHPLVLWGGVANLVEKKLGHLVFANGWSHCQRSLTTPPPTVVAGSTLTFDPCFLSLGQVGISPASFGCCLLWSAGS